MPGREGISCWGIKKHIYAAGVFGKNGERPRPFKEIFDEFYALMGKKDRERRRKVTRQDFLPAFKQGKDQKKRQGKPQGAQIRRPGEQEIEMKSLKMMDSKKKIMVQRR